MAEAIIIVDSTQPYVQQPYPHQYIHFLARGAPTRRKYLDQRLLEKKMHSQILTEAHASERQCQSIEDKYTLCQAEEEAASDECQFAKCLAESRKKGEIDLLLQVKNNVRALPTSTSTPCVKQKIITQLLKVAVAQSVSLNRQKEAIMYHLQVIDKIRAMLECRPFGDLRIIIRLHKQATASSVSLHHQKELTMYHLQVINRISTLLTWSPCPNREITALLQEVAFE